MTVSNSASALGEKVGHVLEAAVARNMIPVIQNLGFDAGPEQMANGSNNKYSIDLVVRDKNKRPVILFETKYIRYKKHNRDKASWLCTAHYNLKKSHHSIRKLTAVLAGNWSEPSQEMMRSFGIEIVMVPFAKLVEVLRRYGVEFDWGEKDRDTPARSLVAFDRLSKAELNRIGDMFLDDIIEKLRRDAKSILQDDTSIDRRVSHVEVVLRTELNESILYEFDSVPDAIAKLASLTLDRPMSNNELK